jgi:replicative DNA helicase
MTQQKNRALSPGEFGKVQPQAVDLEEVVLGAIILEKDAFDRIESILKPECFYNSGHQIIFESISEMHRKQMPIDLMTIVQYMKKTGKDLESIGGPFLLTQMINKVASTAHIEQYARLIYEKYIKREIIAIHNKAMQEAFDDTLDVEDVLSELNTSVDKLNDLAVGQLNDNSLKSIMYMCFNALSERVKNVKLGLSNGIPTGISGLSPWKVSELIIIAARPSLGKTSVMLHFVKVAALSKVPAVIYSLEVDKLQLTDKIIVGESGVNSEYYNDGKLNDAEWSLIDKSMNNIDNLPITIDDTPAASTRYIRSTARRLKKKGKCSIIFIDYLGLMSGDGEYENIRLSKITRELKSLAKELNLPIILLCQLNRSCEDRPDKKPRLSDLRDSGAIEQDADRVLLIHRPDFYGLLGPNKESLAGQGKLIQAKYRNGKIGEIKFYHNESLTRISDEPINDKPF